MGQYIHAVFDSDTGTITIRRVSEYQRALLMGGIRGGSYIVWLIPTLPAVGTTVGFSTMLVAGAATFGGTDFSKA